jgi:hypothetical protein
MKISVRSSLTLFVQTLSILGFACFTLGSLSGCETGDDRSLESAQACLDAASTSAQADNCDAIIEGINTQAAYLIRCSADFVAQGFTGARIANAFANVQSNTAANQTVTMLSYLIFAQTTGNHTAAIAMSDCQASGVESMVRLAVMAQMATSIATISGSIAADLDPSSPSFNATALQSTIQSLVSSPNPTTEAAVGSLVGTAQAAYCETGSSFAGKQVCTDLANAVATGGTDPTAIGAALLQEIQ